jgi:hypothetical protein
LIIITDTPLADISRHWAGHATATRLMAELATCADITPD